MLHKLMPHKESLSMAIRASSFGLLSASAFAIVASGFVAPAPASADEYRAPPRRVVHRHVYPRPVQRVRTVVRTRVVVQQVPVPVPVYQGCGGCSSYAPVYAAPVYSAGCCAPTAAYAPQYYGSGCCAQPYAWTAGYAGHRYGFGFRRGYYGTW
jgi:hypothetical protein